MSKLFKSSAIVSLMTLFSRFFGYARDMVIAVFFGASGTTDAFFIAFRIPNFLRRLFAEGAFSQAFVPVFTEYKEQRPDEVNDLARHVAGAMLAVLSLVTVLGILAAPWIITVFAPGYLDDPERHDLASQLLQITFPYILFISLTAMAGGILNSYGHFAVPSFTPVFLNLSMIGAAIFLAPLFDPPEIALAWGVFIAGIAQLLFQIPFLLKLGIFPWPQFKRAHDGVKRIGKLMLPAIFGSSVVQLNLLFDTLIASFLAAGSISWLYFSDRFVELPLALFGVAIATVILPKLSQHIAQDKPEQFSKTLDWAVQFCLALAIPAMLGLLVLGGPILISLIQYKEFTFTDSQMSAISLSAYALGLPAFMLIKILAPGFFARQDTKTPVKIGIYAMLANMLFNVMIVVPWIWLDAPGPHAGLALATALSAYVNAGWLYWRLRKDAVYQPSAELGSRLLRISLAAVGMFAVVSVFTPALITWDSFSMGERLMHLLGLVLLGASSYFAFAVLLRLRLREIFIK